MLNRLLTYPKTLAFALGWLAVAALPPFYLFPLLFISFSGLLLLLNRSPTARAAFKTGYAFGFAFFAFGLSWIGNALLIDIGAFGWLYPLVLLGCGFFFGLFVAIPSWLSWYGKPFVAKYLAFSAFWVLFEWIRSWFLTGFPWNLLGSVLAFDDNLLQFAVISGTYGLSMMVLLATSAPALWLHYRNRRSLTAALLLPLLIISGLYEFGAYRLAQHPLELSDIRVRIVQPDIPQAMKWNPETLENNFNRYLKMSQAEGLSEIDFTIWGETAAPYPLDLDNYHMRSLQTAVPPHGYLITGLVRYEFDRYSRYFPYNSMFIIDPEGKVAASYDKSHLVPFGEYIPLRQYLPAWIRPITNVIGTFRSGSGPQKISLPGFPPLGGLICYEVIFPHQVVDSADRPHWLINLTNDGWYGDSAGPYQHLVTTQLRAIEEGLTIVRAANTGISAVISPLGRVVASLKLNQSGILDQNLPSPTHLSTTYGKHGNISALIWCFFNLVLAFYISFRNL